MPDRLDEVLRSAQDLGLFGPGDLADARRHAQTLSMLALAGLEITGGLMRWLDLGSGGGLPGLVLAEHLRAGGPGARGTLLDSRQRRARFLEGALTELALTDRVEVVCARAEDAARDPRHRERYDLVVARGFGPPAVTAECAVGFLRPGGRLAVSEPPGDSPARWDTDRLAGLGFDPPEIVHHDRTTAAILHRTPTPLDPRWPRKPGTPQKRPLW